MAINPDEDTEFNDALRKHGIIPQLPSPPRTPSPPPSPTLDEMLADFSPNELQERADDTQDEEEAKLIESLRRRRLDEMRKEQRLARFGEVHPIGRDDYTREVTEASKIDEEGDEMKGQGTGVVCFLYKDGGHVPSATTFDHLRKLAAQYRKTKFVSIVGDKCIPNYPDHNLPTIFVYRKGEIVTQQVAWGSSKPRSLEELEALLFISGAIGLPERMLPGKRTNQDEEEDEILNEESRTRTNLKPTNGRIARNIRASTRDDDEGSDLDL